jgi:Berberine and berberine like
MARSTLVLADDRPGAPEANVFWAGNLAETGQVLHGYQSAWIPASLLKEDQQRNLADALFAAAQYWGVTFHTNKGLAGAPAEAIAAARDTAMSPSVLDAFALIISGAAGLPAYPGIPDHEPDRATARQHADAIDKAMNEVRKLLPNVGSYMAEGNFFDEAWRESFWGSNYARLLAVKDKYDPDGLFFVLDPRRFHEIDVTLASLTFGPLRSPVKPAPYPQGRSRQLQFGRACLLIVRFGLQRYRSWSLHLQRFHGAAHQRAWFQ